MAGLKTLVEEKAQVDLIKNVDERSFHRFQSKL